MKALIKATLALGLAFTATAVGAQERTIKLSSGFPESAVPPKAYGMVADYLAENSNIRAEIFSMSLLSFAETTGGIRDGITDAGYVLTPYFQAEFSETNMVADMTLLVRDGTRAPALAMAAAVTEYVMLDCPDCVAEYATQNQLFLSGGASTEYSMVCKNPITSLADLKGISVRSGAGVFGRWTEHFGGTKVSIPGSEMYEALSQGVVDCTLSGLADVTSFQLMDVAKHISFNAPGGVFGGTASMNLNLDLWREMSPEERKAMLDAGSLMTAATAMIYMSEAVTSEEQIKAAGVTISPVPADIDAATNDFIPGDLAVIEQQFTDLYGVENAGEKIKVMTGLIEKWKGLVDDVEVGDVEAYRTLLVSEVYSKVDPEVYGMQ